MTDESPDVILGTRPVLTRRDKAAMAVAGLGCVVFALFMFDRVRWTYLVIIGVPLVFNLLQQLRPPTIVNHDGISRPWHRSSFLVWASIDHVVQPSYLNEVQVVTTDGRVISVSGVDASLSDDVAALGDKPVRPLHVLAPKPVTREPTQREIEADVARRAEALAAERERMAKSDRRPSSP